MVRGEWSPVPGEASVARRPTHEVKNGIWMLSGGEENSLSPLPDYILASPNQKSIAAKSPPSLLKPQQGPAAQVHGTHLCGWGLRGGVGLTGRLRPVAPGPEDGTQVREEQKQGLHAWGRPCCPAATLSGPCPGATNRRQKLTGGPSPLCRPCRGAD